MYMTELTQTALRREAQESAPHEACGFVTLDGDVGVTHPMANVNESVGEWKMDRGESIRFRIRNRGKIQGTYHTHPKGSIVPSIADMEHCPVRYYMWIVTATEVWRWMRDGANWVGVYEPAFGPAFVPGGAASVRQADQIVAVIGGKGRRVRHYSPERFDALRGDDFSIADFIRQASDS